MKKGLVAKTDQKARVFSLQTSVSEMVLGGKRDAKEVADALQVIKNHRDFAKRLGLAVTSTLNLDPDTERQLKEWQTLYRELFGQEKDFSALKIPERKEGVTRLIVVAQGMNPNRIFNKLKELMPAWKYRDNLDSITSIRKTDQDYAVWIRDRVEADEELKNKSVNELEQSKSITLEERLLLEIKYFRETGKHLDVENITFCAGSRDSGGSVPFVDWRRWRGGVNVDRYNPGNAGGDFRSRLVVS